MDSMRAVLFEGIDVGADDDVAAIDRVQDLVYEAWEAPSAKKRRELAQEALSDFRGLRRRVQHPRRPRIGSRGRA
jgi:hypothetical protein